MTNKIRRTKITIERHEVMIIRRPGKRISVYCGRCQSQVSAFTPDETATMFQISVSEISSLAKAGEIHFIETTEDRLPLVCGGLSNQ